MVQRYENCIDNINNIALQGVRKAKQIKSILNFDIDSINTLNNEITSAKKANVKLAKIE